MSLLVSVNGLASINRSALNNLKKEIILHLRHKIRPILYKEVQNCCLIFLRQIEKKYFSKREMVDAGVFELP